MYYVLKSNQMRPGNLIKFRIHIDELHFYSCKAVNSVYNHPDFIDEQMQKPSHLTIK